MSCIYAIPIHLRLHSTSVRPLDDQTVYVPINPTIFNTICWVAVGRSSHRPSVWWSKYYFDRLKIKQWVAGLDLGHSKLFNFSIGFLQWDDRPIDPATQSGQKSIVRCMLFYPYHKLTSLNQLIKAGLLLWHIYCEVK